MFDEIRDSEHLRSSVECRTSQGRATFTMIEHIALGKDYETLVMQGMEAKNRERMITTSR